MSCMCSSTQSLVEYSSQLGSASRIRSEVSNSMNFLGLSKSRSWRIQMPNSISTSSRMTAQRPPRTESIGPTARASSSLRTTTALKTTPTIRSPMATRNRTRALDISASLSITCRLHVSASRMRATSSRRSLATVVCATSHSCWTLMATGSRSLAKSHWRRQRVSRRQIQAHTAW
jgi:hypothetical protein